MNKIRILLQLTAPELMRCITPADTVAQMIVKLPKLLVQLFAVPKKQDASVKLNITENMENVFPNPNAEKISCDLYSLSLLYMKKPSNMILCNDNFDSF